MKKKICILLITAISIISLTGCASLDRFVTDIKSDVGDGLNRTITVYTANGDLFAEYEGNIDIE